MPSDNWIKGSTGIVWEHFEPGQEVFEQGDVGYRVHVVVALLGPRQSST